MKGTAYVKTVAEVSRRFDEDLSQDYRESVRGVIRRVPEMLRERVDLTVDGRLKCREFRRCAGVERTYRHRSVGSSLTPEMCGGGGANRSNHHLYRKKLQGGEMKNTARGLFGDKTSRGRILFAYSLTRTGKTDSLPVASWTELSILPDIREIFKFEIQKDYQDRCF